MKVFLTFFLLSFFPSSKLLAQDPGKGATRAGFEIDADFKSNLIPSFWNSSNYNPWPATLGDDWSKGINGGNAVLKQVGGVSVPGVTADRRSIWQVDGNSGSNSAVAEGSTFAGNSNKNGDNIAPGQKPYFVQLGGSTPQKNDLTNTFLHGRLDNGQLWIFFAAETRSVNGASYLDFEYNQNGVQVVQNGTQFNLQGPANDPTKNIINGRTVGDILLVINYEGGGNRPTVGIRTWTTTGTWSAELSLANIEAFVTTNITNVDPVAPNKSFTGDGAYSNVTGALQMVEGGVNLTSLKLGGNFDPCNPLSTVTVKTRSSPSYTSELKDYDILKFSATPAAEATVNAITPQCPDPSGNNTFSISGTYAGINPVWSTTSGTLSNQSYVDGVASATLTLPSTSAGASATVTLTVQTDNPQCNKPGTDSKTAIVNPGPNLSATGTNVSCNGAADGYITVTASNYDVIELWKDGSKVVGATLSNGKYTALAPGLYVVKATKNTTISGTVYSCLKETPAITISEPDAVQLSASGTNVSCNGAADGLISASSTTSGASITVNGQPYDASAKYGPGKYTVVASVAGNQGKTCTKSIEVTISEPDAVQLSASGTNVSCNGAADGLISASSTTSGASITVNGQPYDASAKYGPGKYTVVASVAGNQGKTCTKSIEVTISEPDAVQLSASGTNVSCNGAADGLISASSTTSGASITVNGQPYDASAKYGPGKYTVVASVAGNQGKTCTKSIEVTISEPDAVQLSASGTNVSCNGAADGLISASSTTSGASITVNGQPYDASAKYGPGKYTVVASVAGNQGKTCTKSIEVTISEPDAVQLSASGTNVSCNGAADGLISASSTTSGASITVNGQPYDASAKYGPGKYTVVASVAGNQGKTCTKSIEVTISEPDAVQLSASGTNVSCNGAADGLISASSTTSGASITVNGQPYDASAKYGPGKYTVVASVAGNQGKTCTKSIEVTISEPDAVQLSASGTNVSCNGAADGLISASSTTSGASITVNGQPYDASAKYGPGKYTVVASVAGNQGKTCTKSIEVTISEPDAVQLSASGTNETCALNDGTITASSSTPGASITVNGQPYDASAKYGPGKYTVVASVAGNQGKTCTASKDVVIGAAVNCITAHIFPTATTCCNYQGGTPQLLKGCLTMSASTKGPNTTYTVSNAIPGVFFYYGTYTATTGGLTKIVVTQSNTLSWKGFDPQNTSNVRLFTNNCQSVNNVTYSIDKQGNATIQFTAVAGSTYVVSVKYDMKSIIGQITKSLPAAGTPVATYTFQMVVNGSATAYPNSTGALPLYNGCSDNTPNPTGTCPSAAPITVTRQPVDNLSIAVSKLNVLASPNPYNDKVRFVVQSPNSGKASLEVYNMLGQKLHTVFQGDVQAGTSQTFEYAVPEIYRSTLIYLYRQGDKIVTGKLLQARK